MTHKRKKRSVKLNVWDFGGQEIMHATHQFFLSKRSVYLIVLNARESEQQNNIAHWLKMARGYGADTAGPPSPVLVVINKCDEGHLSLNETGLQHEFGVHLQFLRVSCKTGEGAEELRQAIRKAVTTLAHVFDENVPAPYFPVKKSLEKRAKKDNYLDFSAYQNLCRRHKLADPDSQKTLLRFLHDLGVVLNFSDPDNPYRIEDTNILNPEWVTAGVYKVLNDNALATKHHAVLTDRHLRKILAEDDYPGDKKEFIIGMMKKFELCFDYPGREGKSWLVPEALQKDEPALSDWDETKTLNFRFRYDVLPGGLVCRFIVRQRANLTDPPQYWRTGTVLGVNGNRVLVRGKLDAKTIAIQVGGIATRRREALAVVREEFRSINRTVPTLKIEELVPLPDNPKVDVRYQHLLTLEEKGVKEFIPDGTDRVYKVKELLDSIEVPEEAPLPRGHQGDTYHVYPGGIVDKRKQVTKIEKSTITGSTLNWGDISGTVTSSVKQLPAKRKDGPDLKAVIDAFMAALKEAADKEELPADKVKEAISDVEEIVEAAKEPAEPKMLSRANRAVRSLSGIVTGVSALATKATELGTTVTGWFTG